MENRVYINALQSVFWLKKNLLARLGFFLHAPAYHSLVLLVASIALKHYLIANALLLYFRFAFDFTVIACELAFVLSRTPRKRSAWLVLGGRNFYFMRRMLLAVRAI